MEEKKPETPKKKKPVLSKKVAYTIIGAIVVLYLLGYALGSITAAFILLAFIGVIYLAAKNPKSRAWIKKQWEARRK